MTKFEKEFSALEARAHKILVDANLAQNDTSRVEYGAKKLKEDIAKLRDAVYADIPGPITEPEPELEDPEDPEIPDDTDTEPEPIPDPEPEPGPDPIPEEPSVEYSTFGPYDPELPKVKDNSKPTLFLLLNKVSSNTRYNRQEHGIWLTAPMTLRAFVANSGGRTTGGVELTDIYKPRVRYDIAGTKTDWFEYPNYDYILDPADFEPGNYYIKLESDTPGYNWITELTTFTIDGKTGAQTLYAGPHKYDIINGHVMQYTTSSSAGIGPVIINWNGKDAVPVPLKPRPATKYNEAVNITDLHVQAISPYMGGGIMSIYQTEGGGGIIPAATQHYYTGNIWGRRLHWRGGERGQAYAPPFPVDMHISEAGNAYVVSTSGTVMKFDLTGKAEILAGWYNERGTFARGDEATTGWPNPDAKFHGKFMNNSKLGWKEPWALAFREDTIETVPDPTHPRGGVHQVDVQLGVPDTFHGDMDIVVWSKEKEPHEQIPKIYTIGHRLGEVWGACWDAKRKRWWTVTRSSMERWSKSPFTPDQGHRILYWNAADVDAFIVAVDKAYAEGRDPMSVPYPEMHVAYDCPIKLKGDHISYTTSWRWASTWPSGLADRRNLATVRRSQYWKPGAADQAIFVHPEMIKMSSTGKLGISSQYLGIIALFDPDANSGKGAFEETYTDCIQAMGSESHWLNFSFDDGNSGPKDYVRVGSWKRFAGFPYGGPIGTELVANWPTPSLQAFGHQGLGKYFIAPNYPMTVIAKNGAIWMAGGHAGLLRATLPLPTDKSYSASRIATAEAIYKRGTLPKYEITVPSLFYMYGPHGVSQYGNEPFKWRFRPEFFTEEGKPYLEDLLYLHEYYRSGTIYEDYEYELVGHTYQRKVVTA